MNELQAQVIEFHKAFEHPIAESPAAPLEERVRFRARLVLEECLEFVEACFLGTERMSARLQDARALLKTIIDEDVVMVNLPPAADALADIDYVVEGTRLEFGINGTPIAREVHRSNMLKAACNDCDGHGARPDGEACTVCKGTGVHLRKRADGKTLKPECWTPPDITGRLQVQQDNPGVFGLKGVLTGEGTHAYPRTEEDAFKFLHEAGWLSGDAERDRYKVKTLLEFDTSMRLIDMPNDAEYDELRAKARALPPMTDHQKAMQRLDFAYGNLAIDGKASRSAFKIIATTRAEGLGWTDAQFEAWAKNKTWSVP